MTSVTLFLLVFFSSGNRPFVVIDRFLTAAACENVRAELTRGPSGEHPGYLRCVRADVARPER